MSPYELHALAARAVGCTVSLTTGVQRDHMGNKVTGCDDCIGCEFGHARNGDDGGLIDDGMRIKMIGSDVQLIWSCPKCGADVHEDTTPINAIDHAVSVKNDPLCFKCRQA